jgi:hypothetical protein
MANVTNSFDSWIKTPAPTLSWGKKREEELKQQIVDKPSNGAICVGEIQIKEGKFFFVTEDKTYELESVDQIKKISAKKLLKKDIDVIESDGPIKEAKMAKDLKDFMIKKFT